MRNRVINILVSSVAIFLFSCSSPISKTDSLIHEVTIRKAITNKEEVVLSDFVKSDIKYVQLESKPECLLGRGLRFYLNDTFIIAIAENQIFLFDRETGKFIREIGHQGKDPEGYRNTLYSFPYDEKTNVFFTKGWKAFEYYEYDISGNIKKRYNAGFENALATSFATLDDSSNIAFIWNYYGKQKTKLVVFNQDNEIVNTSPQPISFEYDINKNGISILNWDGWFYKNQNKLNLYERFTDTIYRVTHKELIPRFILKNGDYGAPYEKLYTPQYQSEVDNYYFINNLFESKKYLFFSLMFQQFDYWGYYNLEERETHITKNKYGIRNDIDEFIPFQFYSTNNNGELIGFLEAYKIQEWFEENKEIIASLPLELKEFENIGESANPVVMISNLKD